MLGLGDLQRGERYAFFVTFFFHRLIRLLSRYRNTDFVLFWVLSRLSYDDTMLTYDIACQYKKNAVSRPKPDSFAAFDFSRLKFATPMWHGNAHKILCEAMNSIKYKWGVGRTDGEGIERLWALLNAIAYATREQQPGARYDDIEDKLDNMAWQKNITMGMSVLLSFRLHY